MLRTHGHGDERDFRGQDYLENYVNEASSKRKGKNIIEATYATPKMSSENVLTSAHFKFCLGCL